MDFYSICIETRIFSEMRIPETNVSRLKTGCSRSYVYSETPIFFRCSFSVPSSYSFFSSTPIFPRFLFLAEASSFSYTRAVPQNEIQFITDLTNERNGLSFLLSFLFFLIYFFLLSLCAKFSRDYRN